MNNKIFFSYIEKLKRLYEEPRTLSNRINIHFTYKKVYNLMKKFSNHQAKIVYKQTFDLYNNILTSNLEKFK